MGTDRRGKPLSQQLINTIRRMRNHGGMSIREICYETGVAKDTVEKYTKVGADLGRSLPQNEVEVVSNPEDPDSPTVIVNPDDAVEFDDEDIDEFEPDDEDDGDCTACGRSLEDQAIPKISKIIAPGGMLCDGCAVREIDDADWARQMRHDLNAQPEDLSAHDDDPLARDI